MNRQRLHVLFSGRVQGVGFRYTVKRLSTGYELTGAIRNLSDGRVELVTEGERGELQAFQEAIRDSEVGRFIEAEEAAWSPAKNEFRGFAILP